MMLPPGPWKVMAELATFSPGSEGPHTRVLISEQMKGLLDDGCDADLHVANSWGDAGLGTSISPPRIQTPRNSPSNNDSAGSRHSTPCALAAFLHAAR